MKDMKKIKQLAEKIVKIEHQAAQGKTGQEIMSEIQNIISTLSLEEMLEIDEYITTKKLLTK